MSVHFLSLHGPGSRLDDATMSVRVPQTTQSELSLASLPGFDDSNIENNTAKNDTPFPCKTEMLEDFRVKPRDIHKRESHSESCDDGPK